METVTLFLNHTKVSFRVLCKSEGERMGGISLDQVGERGEGEKREADDGLTPSFMGLAGVRDSVMNDARCDAL